MDLQIQVNQVGVRFPGGITALDDVSFEVPRQKILVLLGHSGAGKSTMLRCLNGLQIPTSGDVSIDGVGSLKDRSRLRQHRRQTGMIFQLHHLIGRHSAIQNVLMGRLGYHGTLRSMLPLPKQDIALAMECLDRVGIIDRAHQRADQLSGGERQRVGIARALVQQPRLLLADEPVASLDPTTAHAIMELMSRICEEDGLTAIFNLHQLELARNHADHIIGLANGKKVYDGKPGDLADEDLAKIYRSHRPEQQPAECSATTNHESTQLDPDEEPERSIEHDPEIQSIRA